MAVPTSKAEFKAYCLRNKYTAWYFNIIENAEVRNWKKNTSPCYVEKHHIVPNSFGGKTTVYLTSREHFICHALLTRMLSGEPKAKMVWAIMCLKGKGRYINSRLYTAAKSNLKHTEDAKRKMSDMRKGTQIGSKNHNYGNRGSLNPLYGTKQTEEHVNKRVDKIRGRIHSADSKRKMSQNRPRGPSGKKWFNNGVSETFGLPETRPSSWEFGRLKRKAA